MTMSIGIEQARAAKAKLVARIGTLSALAGIGLTQIGDDYALKVNLTEDADGEIPEIPTEIDGVTILQQVVGAIRRQPVKAAG